MRARAAIVSLLALIFWFNRHSPLIQQSGGEFALCLAMALVCAWPLILWYRRGMDGLPLMGIFAFLHFFYYTAPYLEVRPAFFRYPMDVRILSGVAVVLFLVVAEAVYLVAESRLQPGVFHPRPV